MKLLFQFIHHKNGTRSAVLEMTRQELAREILRTQYVYEDNQEVLDNSNNDYILVLMDKPETGEKEDYSFSVAPIMTAETFLNASMTAQEQESFVSDLKKVADPYELTDEA